MLFSATNSRDENSIIEVFSRSDVARYTRHVLQNVSLQDLSLVDDLIEMTEHEFMSAVGACAYIQFGANGAPSDRIRILLESHPNPKSFIEELLHHTLVNLDPDILTQLTDNPSFTTIMIGGRRKTWFQLCELHRHIAHLCLKIMSNSLCFNICSIPSSYIGNDSCLVQGLLHNAQTQGIITPALIYACVHWTDHVSFVLFDVTDLTIEFLQSHALHWLEILSLANRHAASALRTLSECQVST